MKVAALYDIHGNLPALEAVLAELETVRPDVVLIGGDTLPGPASVEALDRLVVLGDRVRVIHGNGERETLAGDGEEERWLRDRLTPARQDLVASWPATWETALGSRSVLFCHAVPADDVTIFTPRSPRERLRELFAGTGADVVVVGHTHLQFELQVEGRTVLNAGSVGLPYEDAPGAYWLLLDESGHEFRCTPYDVPAAVESLRRLDYPGGWFFDSFWPQPSREEALTEFEKRARA